MHLFNFVYLGFQIKFCFGGTKKSFNFVFLDT